MNLERVIHGSNNLQSNLNVLSKALILNKF